MREKTHNITAWTDGASSGNPGPAGWGVYLENVLYCGPIYYATNNEAEIIAASMAVTLSPVGSQLTIVTDSKLVIGWLTGDYRINHHHIARQIAGFHKNCLSRNVVVSFQRVKGHSRSFGNNMADKGARAASLKERAAQADRDTLIPAVWRGTGVLRP